MPVDYLLRVVDRGTVNGVPVADAYLLRVEGAAESCLMSTATLRLSPVSVEEIVAGLGELGVRVERVAMPSVDEAKSAAAKRRAAKQPPTIGEGI